VKRLAARYYFLILPLLFATAALEQAPASHVAEAANRAARKTPPVASVAQHLFGAIPLSTESREARKFIELALDKYENSMYDVMPRGLLGKGAGLLFLASLPAKSVKSTGTIS
jgi:hypothetical protein